MGALLSAPASFLGSLAGSAVCQLLCACCPQLSGPIGTRIVYASLLLLTALLQCIGMLSSLSPLLVKIPRLCPPNTTNDECKSMVGYLITYKICCGYLFFSLLMILATFAIKSKKSICAQFHDNVHGVKFFILCGFIAAAFAIPTSTQFLNFIRLFGFVGGFIFIVIQLVCVVDFAHLLNESWLERIESGGSRWWAGAQVIVSLISLIASIVIYTLILVYYGHLPLHCFIVTSNILISIIATIVSLLSIVREYQPTSGVLQSSLVSCYVSYITWTAISSDPNGTTPLATSKISSSVIVFASLAIFILSVMYSVFSKTFTNRVKGQSEDEQNEDLDYTYWTMHLLLMFASLYITMTFTSWLKPTSDLQNFIRNQGAFWVKTSSGWLCLVIYIWTCVAPCILRDRDFG